jgi:hypothetical protein
MSRNVAPEDDIGGTYTDAQLRRVIRGFALAGFLVGAILGVLVGGWLAV